MTMDNKVLKACKKRTGFMVVLVSLIIIVSGLLVYFLKFSPGGKFAPCDDASTEASCLSYKKDFQDAEEIRKQYETSDGFFSNSLSFITGDDEEKAKQLAEIRRLYENACQGGSGYGQACDRLAEMPKDEAE